MSEYQENEMVTLTLERYEKLNQDINDLKKEIDLFESLFITEDIGNSIIVTINKTWIEEWAKTKFDYSTFLEKKPVSEIKWI